VTLLDAIGGPLNDGNNLCQTALVDGPFAPIEGVSPLEAPYSGTYAPASPLAAFAGQPATGTWTLHAADSTSFDTGSVRAFSIYASGYTCE
jgi:hypothetical protein